MLRAVARPNPPILRDVCCPETYGALGNGSTDDTAAFTKAIADGRPILIDPSKNYRISGPYTVDSSTNCPGIVSIGGRGTITPINTTSSTYLFTITKTDFFVQNIFCNGPYTGDLVVPPSLDRFFYFRSSGVGARWRVENCRFYGAKYAFIQGAQCDDVQVRHNIFDNMMQEAFTIDNSLDVLIEGNVVRGCAFESPGNSSAGIRYGSIGGAVAVGSRVNILNNLIYQCGLNNTQEAIDITAASGTQILILGNQMIECGNGGVEAKCSSSSLSPDEYTFIKCVGNLVKMGGAASQGCGFNFHTTSPTPPDGKPAMVLLASNVVGCDSTPSSGATFYGATISGYYDFSVVGNHLVRLARGIECNPGPTATNQEQNVHIAGNVIDVSNVGVHATGTGTITNLRIVGNDIKGASRGVACDTETVTTINLEVDHNYIEATAGNAMEIRAVSGGNVSHNRLVSAGGAAIVFQGSTTPPANVSVTDNKITSSTNGVTASTGSGISIVGNKFAIPAGSRCVSGAGTWTAANNIRGTASSDPTASVAASVGDTWLNDLSSSTTVKEWVCITAGNTGAATLKAVALS